MLPWHFILISMNTAWNLCEKRWLCAKEIQTHRLVCLDVYINLCFGVGYCIGNQGYRYC